MVCKMDKKHTLFLLFIVNTHDLVVISFLNMCLHLKDKLLVQSYQGPKLKLSLNKCYSRILRVFRV